MITFSEFHRAVTDNVYPAPTREQYNTIINMAKSAGNITTKEELAMFLAQVLWESAGLQVIKHKCFNEVISKVTFANIKFYDFI